MSISDDATAPTRTEPAKPDASVIRRLTDAGLDLIPLHSHDASGERVNSPGKQPLHSNWTKRAYSAEEVARHVLAGGNLGVRLRAEQLVVDVDPRNGGDESLARLQAGLGIDLADWPTVRTGGGGRHIYMAKPAALRVRNELPDYPGVEFKSEGRQVVAPGSVHPQTKARYVLSDPLDEIGAPDVAPQGLLEAIERRRNTPIDGDEATIEPDELASVLSLVDARAYGRGKHEEWLQLSMACHAATDGRAEAEWLAWCTSDPDYAGSEDALSHRWYSFDAKLEGGVGFGTLVMHARRFPGAEARLIEVLRGDPADAFPPLTDDELRTAAALAPRTIVVRPGKLPQIVDEAEAALVVSGRPIFQRGTTLVRTVTIEDDDPFDDGIRRDRGSLALLEVRKHWLREQLARSASWRRRPPGKPGSKPKLVPADPPMDIAEHLLGRGEWSFRPVRAIVRAPTISQDGRVIQRPGYDERSRLILDLSEDQFPEVPDAPTHEQALGSLRALRHPLRGFPFTNGAEAVALSAILTGLVRPSLNSAPLHAIDAPAAGTGKSMLAEAIGIVATGSRPAAMSQGAKGEEFEKRLASSLMAGDQVLLIDNCNRPLEGEVLCSMLTQAKVKTRVLGKSEIVELPSACLVLATGNNLSFTNDVGRRSLVCRLDAGVERPDQRSFDFDPRAEAGQKRTELVSAALTIMRAYQSAGRPLAGSLTAAGSFEAWTVAVREPLVWLGLDDPAKTLDQALGEDPEIEFLKEMLPLWRSVHGDRPVTVRHILQSTDDRCIELREMLADHMCGGGWNAKSIGRGLRKRRGRVAGNLRLEAGDEVRDGATWRVVERAS